MAAVQINPRTGITPVACGGCGWSAGGQLVMVDRWITDYPPIPYVPLIEFYSDSFGDPDDRVNECPVCFEEIYPGGVVASTVASTVRTAQDVLAYIDHVEHWMDTPKRRRLAA